MRWEYYFKLLQQFYKENGHSNVPKNHPLAYWVQDQRDGAPYLPAEKLEALLTVDFLFDEEDDDRLDEQWEDMYDQMVEYKYIHGHVRVPEPHPLYAWKVSQTLASLNADQRARLEDLGFSFNAWKNMYAELLDYQAQYGSIVVSRSKNTRLAFWLRQQRTLHQANQLSPKKLQLLDDLGICGNNRNAVGAPKSKAVATVQEKKPVVKKQVPKKENTASSKRKRSDSEKTDIIQKNKKKKVEKKVAQGPAKANLEGIPKDYPIGSYVRKKFPDFGWRTGVIVAKIHTPAGKLKWQVCFTNNAYEEHSAKKMDPLVDDWQAASRVKQQAAAYPVGTKILKYFPDLGDNDWGWYRGKVMQVDAKDGIYLVRYNDGDKEELDHAEVGRYLRLGKEDIVGKK